jgi:hypothetical protein
MIRHPLRIVFTALALYTLFPLFAGIHFHGNILESAGLATGLVLVSSAIYWLLDGLESAFTVKLAHAKISELAKLGVLSVSWLLTYIVLPGLVLKLAAHVLPAGMLGVGGIGSVLMGGLVLFIIGTFTGAYARQPEKCNSCMQADKTDDDDESKPTSEK